MSAPDYAPLFYWVRTREDIRKRKAMGLRQDSWTLDPIFLEWRFCNVRREDDRVTEWIRLNTLQLALRRLDAGEEPTDLVAERFRLSG